MSALADLYPAISDAAERINQDTLSRPEASDLLGVHRNTLEIWLLKGKLPYVKVAALVRIPRAAVEELLAAGPQ